MQHLVEDLCTENIQCWLKLSMLNRQIDQWNMHCSLSLKPHLQDRIDQLDRMLLWMYQGRKIQLDKVSAKMIR